MPRPKSLRGEIAKAVGVTPTVVSKYWARGMPRESVKEAVAWYKKNIPPSTRPKKKAARKVTKKAATQRATELETTDSAGVVMITGDGLGKGIQDLMADCEDLARRLADAKKRTDEEDETYFRREHTSRLEQLRKIEKDYQAILREQSKSLLISEVSEVFGKIVTKIVVMLERMPTRATKHLQGPERQRAIAGLKMVEMEMKNELHGFSLTSAD